VPRNVALCQVWPLLGEPSSDQIARALAHGQSTLTLMNGIVTCRHQVHQRNVLQQAAHISRGSLHYHLIPSTIKQQLAERRPMRQRQQACHATAATEKLEAKPMKPDAFIQVGAVDLWAHLTA
jgi:hypothetical protein